jgi:hypothetical protein
MRVLLLWVSLMLGTGALAQPKEEPVPEGIFGLPEVRIFIDSPVWFAWKLPASKFTLAYLQGTEKPPTGHLVVLDGKGRLDEQRTEALKAALEQVDPSGKCMEVGADRMPLLMPLGSKALVMQSGVAPNGACLFTWNARGATIEMRVAASAQEFCEPSGCPPAQCWLTEDCWLPESPDLDLVRKRLHPSSLAQSLMEVTGPGKAVLAATLPGLERVLLWVPSWRPADLGDSAKGKDSRLFVYDPRRKVIDAALTRELARVLQAPVDECQGLGTVEQLLRRGNGVYLQQRYAQGQVRLSCSSTVRWNAKARKFELQNAPASEGSQGTRPRAEEEERTPVQLREAVKSLEKYQGNQ